MFCRCFSFVRDFLVFDNLPLIEAGEAGFLDSRDMDKHILAAVLRLNKSIPLLRVEPLHGAERHCLISTVDVLRYRCRLGLTMGLVEPREGIGCAQGRGRSNLRVRMATRRQISGLISSSSISKNGYVIGTGHSAGAGGHASSV